MSGTNTLGLIATIGGALVSILTRTPRYIGPIIPGVVVEETHHDALTTTDNPIDTGADVTDHAFMEPSHVEIVAAWSDSPLGWGYSARVYGQLLALQSSRVLIDVATGKRLYKNMLIADITTRTDKETNTSLIASIRCKYISVVSTSATTVPPRDVQATPAVSAPVEQVGTQQPTVVPNQSLLTQGANAVKSLL